MAKITPAVLAVELAELHQLEKDLLKLRDERLDAYSKGRLGFKETIEIIPPTKGAVGIVQRGFSIQDDPIDLQGKYQSFCEKRAKYRKLRSLIKSSGHSLAAEPLLDFSVTQTLALGERKVRASDATRLITKLGIASNPTLEHEKSEVASDKGEDPSNSERNVISAVGTPQPKKEPKFRSELQELMYQTLKDCKEKKKHFKLTRDKADRMAEKLRIDIGTDLAEDRHWNNCQQAETRARRLLDLPPKRTN